VLFAVRPLTPEELYFAVLARVDREEFGARDRSKVDRETIRRFITSTFEGLIEVRRSGDIAQFIHESIKDFLIRNRRLQRLDPALNPHAIGSSHDRLTSCCMTYVMQKELGPLVIDMPQRQKEFAV